MDRDALADGVLLLHFAVVLFNIGGLLIVLVGHDRGWRIVRHRSLRLLHLGLVWFVAVEAALGYACPLTVLEDTLRADAAPQSAGFLQRWLSAVLYWNLPAWMFAAAYAAFALGVTAAFLRKPPSPPGP